MSAMLRSKQVQDETGLSRSTIWRRIRAGTFPAPVELGENSIGWPADVILEWKASRPRRTYGADLAQQKPAAV